MRVLLAGASGAIGLPLVRALREARHEVTGIHRAAEGGRRLAAAGASPIRVDVLDRAALFRTLEGQTFDAVIAELTSLRKPPLRHRDMAVTNRLRTEGTANLAALAERCRARRFLTQSMVFGYGYRDFGERVLTESDPFGEPGRGRFSPHLAALRANEEQVLGANAVEGIALRYGAFYGPGPAGDTLVAALRRRRLPGFRPAGVLPWVYIDDAAAATVAALERGRPATAYNVVDDEPVSMPELVTAVAAAIGAPRPWSLPAWTLAAMPYLQAMIRGGLRVANAQAKSQLGWTPASATYREGVARMARHYLEVNNGPYY